MQKAQPVQVDEVRFTATALEVVLADGRVLSAPIDRFPRLRGGSPAALLNWRITDAGDCVHWPDLNEDIRLSTLLAQQTRSL
jgi:hypothetical protein